MKRTSLLCSSKLRSGFAGGGACRSQTLMLPSPLADTRNVLVVLAPGAVIQAIRRVEHRHLSEPVRRDLLTMPKRGRDGQMLTGASMRVSSSAASTVHDMASM